MAQYSIAVADLQIAGQAAEHVIILEMDDQGNKIGEIDGGPANKGGNGVADFATDPTAFFPNARNLYVQSIRRPAPPVIFIIMANP